jgi:hypothetical protein
MSQTKMRLPLTALFFAALTFTASSCGKSQASAPPARMNLVMQSIHDYGRGHQPQPAPLPTAMPQETESLYGAHVNNLFVQEDFAGLEKLAQQYRVEKDRVIGGYWKNDVFYNVAYPWAFPSHSGAMQDSDYLALIARTKKWIAAYPDSATARILLAHIYTAYADQARGTGYANSVSDDQWKLFHERTSQAKAVLLEAATLQEKDAHWYSVMQMVAFQEGWDKAEASDLLDQAVAFQPDYYHFYRLHAQYLQPQWYGESGDIQAFAEEASAKLPEPDSSILYFQIISSLSCYCQQHTDALPHASWKKIKNGYVNLTRRYGPTNLTANRFSEMAFVFGDQNAAQDAFSIITSREPSVWLSEETFQSAKTWAKTSYSVLSP